MATKKFKIGYPSFAAKTGGYGNVPGQTQSNVKPIGSGIGGKLTNSLSSSAAQNTPPTFTPQVPSGANYAAAQAGGAPQLSNAGSGGGTTGDPRDPTYWTDVAKIKQTFDTNTSSYNLQQTQAQTSMDNALQALDKQEPIDVSNARGSYNNAGLFYSSKLTGATGDLTSQYGTKRGEARTGFSNLVDQLNILRNTNQNTYGTGPGGALTGTAYLDALNAGVGRQTAADQAAAAANALVAPPAANDPGQPSGVAALIQKWQNLPYQQHAATVNGVNGMWHVYPDGRRVFVKDR